MKWLLKFIPSRAAIIGILAAIFAALFAWARRDAKKDLKQSLEKKDIQNAKDISDRVRTDRADPERVHDYDDVGWRD